MEAYLITDEAEVATKAKAWDEMNKEYLEAQAAKQAAREQMAAARGLSSIWGRPNDANVLDLRARPSHYRPRQPQRPAPVDIPKTPDLKIMRTDGRTDSRCQFFFS